MISFTAMCNMPCASCPSRSQPNYCLSCYIDANVSLLKYLYNGVCSIICPSHTFYPINSTSTYLFTCLTCS